MKSQHILLLSQHLSQKTFLGQNTLATDWGILALECFPDLTSSFTQKQKAFTWFCVNDYQSFARAQSMTISLPKIHCGLQLYGCASKFSFLIFSNLYPAKNFDCIVFCLFFGFSLRELLSVAVMKLRQSKAEKIILQHQAD